MYKKKKLAKKKHRKNKLRVKAKIRESLLKAKPKSQKVIVEKTAEIAANEKVQTEKAPAKKKATAKK